MVNSHNLQIVSVLENAISRQELILSYKRINGVASTVAEKSMLAYLYEQLLLAHHFQNQLSIRKSRWLPS
jgi:hypothetical protein